MIHILVSLVLQGSQYFTVYSTCCDVKNWKEKSCNNFVVKNVSLTCAFERGWILHANIVHAISLVKKRHILVCHDAIYS